MAEESLKRMGAHFAELSKIGNLGESSEDGFLRASWSDDESAAMAYIFRQAQEFDLFSRYDEVGNLYVRTIDLPGPTIQVASHLDTVPNGGPYDGAAGVVAGLEAIQIIRDMGNFVSKALELVVWRGEESATYNEVYKGSRAAFGVAPIGMLGNTFQGQSLEDAIISQGYTVDCIKEGKPTFGHTPADDIDAHLELHIEQGSALWVNNTDIGIATSIRGPVRYQVWVKGEFDHSGATPMGTDYRADANLAAAYMQVRLDELGKSYIGMWQDLVQTVGIINSDSDINANHPQIYQNSLTKVSGLAYFTLDIRSDNNSTKTEYSSKAEKLIYYTAREFGVEVKIINTSSSDAIEELNPDIQTKIKIANDSFGYLSQDLASGAGHDVAVVSKVPKSDGTPIPTGLILIPCRHGKSHCPEEYVTIDAVFKGANVLAQVMYDLAK